jgi:hypothetical protein
VKEKSEPDRRTNADPLSLKARPRNQNEWDFSSPNVHRSRNEHEKVPEPEGIEKARRTSVEH